MDNQHIYSHSWSFMWKNKGTLGLYSLQITVLFALIFPIAKSVHSLWVGIPLAAVLVAVYWAFLVAMGIRFDRAVLLGEPLPRNLAPDLLSRRAWRLFGFLILGSVSWFPLDYLSATSGGNLAIQLIYLGYVAFYHAFLLHLTCISIDKPIEWHGVIDLFKRRWARLFVHFYLLLAHGLFFGCIVIGIIFFLLSLVLPGDDVQTLPTLLKSRTKELFDTPWSPQMILIYMRYSLVSGFLIACSLIAFRSASSYLYRWFEGMPTPDAPPTSA